MDRKVILYIAMSLDGYIADKKGSVNWISDNIDSVEVDNGYGEFISDIDTLIMGRNTYEQIITELSPNEWVYKGIESYVVTTKLQPDNENVHFINSNICDFVKKLKRDNGKSIWVVGGEKLFNCLNQSGLIDEYHITIVPTILGGGIRLFDECDETVKLHLIDSVKCNGFVSVKYIKQNYK